MPAASSSESPLLMISISRSSYYKMGKESSLGMIRHIGLIAQCLIFPLLLLERISRSIDGPRLSGCIIARVGKVQVVVRSQYIHCLLYTSDAADE